LRPLGSDREIHRLFFPEPDPTRMSRTPAPTAQAPNVNPVFPLLLLETMRDMDRPDEVLEGENLAVSMPRRLGLSDVVHLRIHKLRDETKRGRLQSPEVVEDLVRLVIRRPDAEEIFEEAGRRMARHAWAARTGAVRVGLRLLPAGMRLAAGGARLEVKERPLHVRMDGCLTAVADPGGAACAFYTGTLAEILTEYTGRPHAAQHPRCEARGAGACEWTATVIG
jgi:predicted hydrocarbon binding protein